jgi:hypothetical protein
MQASQEADLVTDGRVLIAILLMGLAAAIGKGLEFWRWYVDREPIMDTATNGGVKIETYSR